MSGLFAPLVYSLCFVTSSLCAVLLGRMYWRSKSSLVFWSACCFGLLGAANLLLVVDLALLPAADYRLARYCMTLAAVSVLLFGFVWGRED